MEPFYGDFDLQVRWTSSGVAGTADSTYPLAWSLTSNDEGWITIPLSETFTADPFVDKEGDFSGQEYDSTRVFHVYEGGFVGTDSLSFTVSYLELVYRTEYVVTGSRR